jgi:amino acid adenylation domain-containing protein
MPDGDKQPDWTAVADPDGKPGILSLTSTDFMTHLKTLGIEVRAKGGKLLLNAPVGALSPELQTELRRRKPELLAILEAERHDGQERCAPLTYAQQRLWLVERFTPNVIAYNIPQSWIVEGPIDVEVLRRAVDRLVQRHAALRTRIDIRDGEAVQVVVKSVEVPFRFAELSTHDGLGISESQLEEILIQEGRKPFALDRAPLIRFHLFKMSENKHVISYNIHHIVADQWSLNTIKRDLAALFIESTSGRAADLPALPLQYADVAIRERSDAATRLHARQLDYWRNRLKGTRTLLELPFSAARPPEQSYAGETLSVTLNSDLSRQLRKLAASCNTSLYLLMLAAFALLLYRYTGQRDLCIGTPITGRKLREEEDIVGLFVNMIPLRCEVESKVGFDQLLEHVSRAVLTDFDHSDIPFQKLVTELHPHRSLSHSPLFQITFALNPKGASVDDVQQETFIGTSKFDLSLQIAEQANTLDAHFEFRTDLFSRCDIERFGQHFIELSKSIVLAPQDPIGSLALITGEDRCAFQQWNATGLSFDRSDTLISLFEEQVSLHSDAAALCCGDTIYTFRELHQRVVRMASELSAMGAERGVYVAICLERSAELIVSILAVLKAGAAYLPLDPNYPEERLAFTLRDSETRLMIARSSDLSERIAANHPALSVAHPSTVSGGLDREGEATQAAHLDTAAPEDAAYLIYTSGSTGKPKGVVVEHRNAVALLAWAKNYFDRESLRGVLASTSVCFDLSIFELFLPLSTGNTIVLVNDVLELPKSAHAGKVTLVNTVPSAMNALLQAGLPPSVRTVCMAGELLPQDLVERVYATGVKQVFDLYGPTETTTYSTCSLRLPGGSSNIGQPISNTRIYLFEENLSQVPPGAIGEIVIGGEGVARGYLNQPELTDERFVRLPEIEPGSRLYRTGDVARQRDDGSLVYLGRRDQQIKLRGHRIELGEIEAVLREESGVPQVVVVVDQRASGDVLVAFVAPSTGEHSEVQQWIVALRRRLPAYMIPMRIVALDALPLTPNGKIDRKALRLPAETQASDGTSLPQDLLEQWLANIWTLRLGKKQIARNAHFFEDLGGHSLVAFEIFAEIEKRIGVSMMLATLFQAPTVELLAAAIRLKEWKSPEHLRFVASGLAETVVYVIGDPSRTLPEEIRTSGERVMAIASGMARPEIDVWAREIVAFEVGRPPLLVVAHGSDEETMRRLAADLAQSGFADISLRTLT